jgi:predicted transposase/invertase (TIGR01784 family)
MPKSDELIVKPKLDVVFKILFTEHVDLLKIFLSDALNMPEDDFADIKVLNPEITPDIVGEKYARLDIVVTKPDGTKINIELQNIDEGDYKERSVFYCSRMFTRDVNSGQDYNSIPKTICINIIQFTLFPEEDYICTVFPTIQESGKILTDKWEIIYFQTKKLPESVNDDLSEWLKFFTIKTEKELLSMQSRTQSTGIRKAISIVENMNNNDIYKSLAEQREEALFNERLAMGAMFRKGIDEGIQQGRVEGILEGIFEGEQKAKHELARNMLRGNYSIAEITSLTGLSASEINEI